MVHSSPIPGVFAEIILIGNAAEMIYSVPFDVRHANGALMNVKVRGVHRTPTVSTLLKPEYTDFSPDRYQLCFIFIPQLAHRIIFSKRQMRIHLETEYHFRTLANAAGHPGD